MIDRIRVLSIACFLIACAYAQPYQDTVFLQDYAEKFSLQTNHYSNQLQQIRSDRNGGIQVVSQKGLLQPANAQLVEDRRYRPLTDRNIRAIETHQGQFVYLTDRAILSNAWAGRLYIEHGMSDARHFAIATKERILIAAREHLMLLEEGKMAWEQQIESFEPLELLFDADRNRFLILSTQRVYQLDLHTRSFTQLYEGEELSAMEVNGPQIILGTRSGILSLDGITGKASALNQRLPHTEISCIRSIRGRIWYGSSYGAFTEREAGKYTYYASERWLPDNHVLDLAEGPDQSVLILTKRGLSRIHFEPMTLADKAAHFQKIQRLRHVRFGFTATVRLEKKGDVSTTVLRDTDNDGLWTSMYLAGELFRYAVTQSEDAKQNAYEAFEAMERLTEISGIHGFPARTYEWDSYQSSDNDPYLPEDQKIWRLTPDKHWRWKSTTSSDESCGHFFVYALFAEIAPDQAWKDRAIRQIKIQMDHIIEHDWYLVSWNGKPTRWGRWHPEYVNSFPIAVGDRRLNSTLILAFLQTAFHFTGEERYKDKAYELIRQHGYLENTLRPATVIGKVEGQFLSDSWNHSDDEMYFLTIPALVKYAFTEDLRKQYLESVRSHWEIERNEKNPLWNYLYALVGGKEYDWEESAWWLREFPMDLIAWDVSNAHRKDLVKVAPNFRKQEYSEVLPRDERPLHLHNRAYRNHGGEGGMREYGPYIYLLPYWAGRYVGGIAAPE